MEKLNKENKEFRSKLQEIDREFKETSKAMEKLSDENKALSRKVVSKVTEIEDENKHSSSQAENTAKQNERLKDALALQLDYIAAYNNGFSERNDRSLKEQTSSPSPWNDVVEGGLVNKISKRVLLHSDTDLLPMLLPKVPK